VETYRGLDLLLNYCQFNCNQFRKAVKDWDANNPKQGKNFGSVIMKNKLSQVNFDEPEEIEDLKNKLEAALGILLNINAKESKNRLTQIYK
jgi:hypothetical protein